MRQERPLRLPISDNHARGALARLRKAAPLALLAALAVASAAACGPAADPYCADGDIKEWITTLSVTAVWVEDGWSVKQIQLIVDTNNEAFLHLPDDQWSPTSGRVVSALPADPREGEAKKVILLPDAGVQAMSVRAPVICQGISQDYEVVLTWTGTPKWGDPVAWKLAPAAK
jgi:hypothetical protein